MTDLGAMVRLLLNPLALALAGCTGLAMLTLARPLAARFGARVALAAAAIASAGLILATTAPVTHPGALLRLAEVWDASRAITWLGSGWTDVLLVPRTVEGWANVVLFVPAGYAWTRLTGRPGRVLGTLVLVALLAESLQAAVGIRVAEPRDLVANTSGAAFGVLAGATVGAVQRLGARAVLERVTSPRVLAALVLGVVLAGIGIRIVQGTLEDRADQEQMALLRAVEDAYAGTRADDVAAIGGPRAYAAFSQRPGRQADYLGRLDEGLYEARFRVDGTARPRCVLVRWTPDRMAVTPASGAACTVFREIGLPARDAP